MNVNELSKAERMRFYRLGYKNQDIQNVLDKQQTAEAIDTTQQMLAQQQEEIEQLKSEGSYDEAMQSQQDPRNTASMFHYQDQDNLIKWQLELDSILERIEHMLRGDKIHFMNGNMIWQKAKTSAEVILNEFGVAEIMRILSMYLNRNTILSNYSEEVINEKMMDFGHELTDLFFLKYEAMGLNDIEKRKLYPMLVRQLIDTVHSSYLRALHGGERESLREARHITQTDQMGSYGQGGGVVVNSTPQLRERGVLNPMRYFMGKGKR